MEALSQIRRTLAIAEDLRNQGQDPELRVTFLANVRLYYEFAIELLQGLNLKAPGSRYDLTAFEINEQATARDLLDALAESPAERSKAVPTDLAPMREQLLRQMRETVVRMSSQRPSNAATTAKQALDLDNLRMRLYETEQRVNEADRQAQANKYTEPLRAIEIQQLLDDNSLLLEYALGDKKSYLWALTTKTVSSFVLPARSEIESTAGHFYDLINARNVFIKGETPRGRRSRIAAADAASLQLAADLSRILLRPVAGLLRAKRVLIVREGALHELPFGALPEPGKAASPTISRLWWTMKFRMSHQALRLAQSNATEKSALWGRRSVLSPIPFCRSQTNDLSVVPGRSMLVP